MEGKVYKINNFYEFIVEKYEEDKLNFVGKIRNLLTGNEKIVLLDTTTLFLLNDENLKLNEVMTLPKEELEKLVKEKKIIKTNVFDIWKNVVKVNEDLLFEAMTGLDKRSRHYLESCKRNIGLIKRESNYEELDFESIKIYDIYFNTSTIKVGKINDEYIAQFSVRTDVDDYTIVKLYFSKFPTKNNIETAELIDDIYSYFAMNRFKKTYIIKCWECGCERHWLDIPAENLKERFDKLKEQYCGC